MLLSAAAGLGPALQRACLCLVGGIHVGIHLRHVCVVCVMPSPSPSPSPMPAHAHAGGSAAVRSAHPPRPARLARDGGGARAIGERAQSGDGLAHGLGAAGAAHTVRHGIDHRHADTPTDYHATRYTLHTTHYTLHTTHYTLHTRQRQTGDMHIAIAVAVAPSPGFVRLLLWLATIHHARSLRRLIGIALLPPARHRVRLAWQTFALGVHTTDKLRF
ncbi:hypothetical protein COCMIDRAFT_30178 [Bipolaris oryzae ATCC 44560]|uniref:Uncharacterized protein n=1 Tax=Bipolaris oryzae ATCC 44560 TaxID=930090 RepID=W6ZB89_COCMI|nr:uncharacterized protein COCMIDRAFT_30178 [Bipolaris oryzae ATCC 44560]EUC40986.1 hypothetical protein COCMIDRAFT_30178 [Bipolaris oryzae ATCC 44560]